MKKLIVLFTIVGAVSTWMVLAAEKTKSSSKSDAAAAKTEHKIVATNEVQWGDAQPSLPPGAKIAVLDADPNKAGSFTVRLQMPAGYRIPPHTHPTTERVTAISGNARLGMGEKFDESAAKDVIPGTFVVLPAGMAHFGYATEESVLQIQSEGQFKITYINPSDDPRNAKKQ